MENALIELSNSLAAAVERAGQTVVAVSARPRVSSSGVHWRKGVVVTAEHTVKRDEEITVALPDGSTLPAKLAGRDPGTDLAVLKVDVAGMSSPEFDAAEGLQAGNLVLTVGRSPETGVNATMGVISAVSGSWRTWRGGRIDQFIRLDASLYPGSSGAAVVSTQGQVLGIATGGLSRIAGLAIPVSTINRVIDELLAKGHVSRGYLGVGLQPVALPAALAKQLGLTDASGVIVLTVEPNGPAERAGVMIGDIFVALDGKPLKDTDDIQSALEGDMAGRALQALLVRGGARQEISIIVGERK